MVQHYQDDLVRGLLKNFTLYGTGRKPDVAALAEIGTIKPPPRPALSAPRCGESCGAE